MDWLICVDNTEYEASLELRKLYRRLPPNDPRDEALGLVRVVDESGEDYLYSDKLFQPIQIPATLEHRLTARQAA